jgi:hypothetical protein
VPFTLFFPQNILVVIKAAFVMFPWIGAEVSSRKFLPSKKEISTTCNHNSQREIAAFLMALHSYPEYFEKNPLLSFEQHMVRLADEGLQAAANTAG